MLRRLLCSAALLCAGRVASAQSGGLAPEVVEFLLPMGARSIGMGQAAVASAIGSDAIWWNPALIAHGPREVALSAGSNSLVGSTDAVASVIIPVQRVGAVALSLRYLNEGEFPSAPLTDPNGQTAGTFFVTSTIAAATFAAPFGPRLSAGVTYKLWNERFSCTGTCDTPPAQPQTSAVDLGLRYLLRKDTTVAIGVALRNAGLKLQVNDAPQADALPTRLDVGVLVTPKLSQLPPEARLRVAADVISRVNGIGGPGYRVGSEVSWRERFQARAGYLVYGPDGSSGAAFGVGFSTGKLQIDLAQMASDASTGSAPTYLSLRYIF